MRRIGFAAILIVLASHNAFAADLNGYTAKYECRSGNPNCNVDVVTLAAQPCQQTITTWTSPTTDWSAINWSNNVICIEVGDHTGRGKLSIGASGTSGTRKIVKGVKTDGTLADKPWSVSAVNTAKIRPITCNGRDYIIVARLWARANSSDNKSHYVTNCENVIYHEILIDNQTPTGITGWMPLEIADVGGNSTNFTLQNSVVRNSGKKTNVDVPCLYPASPDIRIVNNEIYNCGGDGIVADNGSNPLRLKIENNDIYQTDSYLIGCDGGAGTDCNCGEDGIDIKDSNITNPVDRIEVIHNRFWGWRTSYESCSGSGSAGFAVNAGGITPKHFVLIKNNIIAGVANGVNMRSNTTNWTIIGNLFYDVNHAYTPQDAPNNGDGEYSIAVRFASTDDHKMYLNTVVDSKYGLWTNGGGENNDLRCNVFVNVQQITRTNSPGWGTGSTADYNAFYNTSAFLWVTGPDHSLVYGRAEDGQALPYCYYRKLHTGYERACIPNALPTPNSPHYRRCDPEVGSRLGAIP